MKKIRFMNIIVIVVTIGVCCAVLREYYWYNNWSRKGISESKEKGEHLRRAIEKYHADKTKLPETLTDLIPEYLPVIQPPTAGSQVWRYHKNADGVHFELMFQAQTAFPMCVYDSKHPQMGWHIVDDQ